MEDPDTLAEQAEAEIQLLKDQCAAACYDTHSREALWAGIMGWIKHPRFAEGKPVTHLQCVVLNELQFTLSTTELRDEGWALICELAKTWKRERNESLMAALNIASFEIIVDPPQGHEELKRLFTLAANPEARWAVFAAYENYPWLLQEHACLYSEGAVSDTDCERWLKERGLGNPELLQRERRLREDDD